MANAGANQCTGLNSDEDPDIREEPEDEENADDDSWNGDWEIGALSDEDPEEELDDIPDSISSLSAKDAHMISSMRQHGWEYGELC